MKNTLLEKSNQPFDSLAERTEYVREVTKLMLWHVRQLIRREDVDFDTAVSSRVGINRLTVFWGTPRNKTLADPDGWKRIVRELRGVFFKQHENDPTTDAIETEGLELLWPHLEPVIEAHVAEDARWLSDSFGCFRYEFVPYYGNKGSKDHLTLHVRNAYQPDTMFQHVPELIGSLQEIVGRAKRCRVRSVRIVVEQPASLCRTIPSSLGRGGAAGTARRPLRLVGTIHEPSRWIPFQEC
ncbi:MAG: hypothetical protein GXP25_16880 [Planctomycetes bacterium]|nr:hypothetical protein [Planctomycetota bacterium]